MTDGETNASLRKGDVRLPIVAVVDAGQGADPAFRRGVSVLERPFDDRTLVATGHGRSGFLLAPWTAERIAAELRVGALR